MSACTQPDVTAPEPVTVRVAAIINEVNADSWLLQEIENEAALARVFDPETWTFHIEARPAGEPEDYSLCRGSDDGTRLTTQSTAIVVRSGIEHIASQPLAALDVEGEDRLRGGLTITLPGEAPVDIMSVHLKSGCFSGEEAVACPVLLGQIPVLERSIDERSAAGRAVIVGGTSTGASRQRAMASGRISMTATRWACPWQGPEPVRGAIRAIGNSSIFSCSTKQLPATRWKARFLKQRSPVPANATLQTAALLRRIYAGPTRLSQSPTDR